MENQEYKIVGIINDVEDVLDSLRSAQLHFLEDRKTRYSWLDYSIQRLDGVIKRYKQDEEESNV